MYYVLLNITWGDRTCCISHYQAIYWDQHPAVCIFVRKDLPFSKMSISHNCKVKDLEICAI